MARRLGVTRSKILSFSGLALAAMTCPILAGAQAKPPSQSPAPAQKPPMGPPAPVSRHFPILLIATGNAPFWSARIGMKGPERLERRGYPPITLVPGDVSEDTPSLAWTCRAMDGDTGADDTVHLQRQACTIPSSDTKYPFQIELDHAQIGKLQGCARIDPSQFPEYKQKDLDEDDPDKKPVGPPPITDFKPPVAYAYLESSGSIVLRRYGANHFAGAKGSQISVSHDGRQVLFTREASSSASSIWLYDSTSGGTTEWLGGGVQRPFWSPDDTRIAFLKQAGPGWQIWTAPESAPQLATQTYSGGVIALDGWSDAHTLLAADSDNFNWISDTGNIVATLPAKELYGDQYGRPMPDYVRVNPANPDILLVSAPILKPPAGTPTDPQTGSGAGFFYYEVRSKRRVLLSPPDQFATEAEWSRDGIQIFFTSREPRGGSVEDRVFWDGSEVKRYATGSHLVVGQ